MDYQQKKLLLIRLPYWLGIGVDVLWAVALFPPPVFALLVGRPDFRPDMQARSIMWIGGSLMAGWTLLLLWAVRNPIQRRVVILITAVPVVLGMFLTALFGFLAGNSSLIWILVKCTILMISMIASYVLAEKEVQIKKNGSIQDKKIKL